MVRAPPLSPPPADLAAASLPLATVTGPWLRIHLATRGALHWGRSRQFRFDAPDAGYGVLYAGGDDTCAFVETFLRVPGGSGWVSRVDLGARSLSRLRARRPLQLVDLTGHELARLRLDANIFATREYALTQAWSQAFFGHPARPDGLIFHSRHDPDLRSVALFDRIEPLIVAERVHASLLDAAFAPRLGGILDRYGVALL